MLPGVGRWPMPCAEAKGLFPGRGPAGRWPMPCEEAKGLLPGRAPPGRGGALGPGLGAPAPGAAAPGVGAPGVADEASGLAAGASAVAGAAFSGAGVGAGAGLAAGAAGAAGRAGPGVGPEGRAPGVAAGREGPGRAPGRAAGAADDAPPAGADEPSAASAARSLRATGGSMVDEGLLTNSPSSFSFASATLLSTPSSEAISCTRGFATILLSEGLPRTGQTVSCGRVSFRAVHFVSIAVQPFRWRCDSKVCVSSGPDTRNARTKARRVRAFLTHASVSCTHAPRPGRTARSSATRTDPSATTRRSEDRGARARHPTHVRTGSTLHLVIVGTIGPSVVFEDAVGLDVDLGARELGGQASVLPLFADRQRQLVIGHEGAHGLGRGIQDERRGDLRRR